MPRETLWSALELKPFRAVTVYTTSGVSYTITRRESIWPSPQGDAAIISTGDEGYVMVAIEHITSLQISGIQASES